MPAFGVTVEKEATFRAQPERFVNVWHYRITVPTELDYQNLADAVIALDRKFYPNTVTYKSVRVYGPTDGPKENNLMRVVDDVSGNGNKASTGTDMYPELTYVISRYVGRSPGTGRKVFVRKYIRVIKAMNSSTSSVTGILATTERDAIAAEFQSARQITFNAVTFDQVTPRDVLVPSDTQAYCLNYMHIRQIHQ